MMLGQHACSCSIIQLHMPAGSVVLNNSCSNRQPSPTQASICTRPPPSPTQQPNSVQRLAKQHATTAYRQQKKAPAIGATAHPEVGAVAVVGVERKQPQAVVDWHLPPADNV